MNIKKTLFLCLPAPIADTRAESRRKRAELSLIFKEFTLWHRNFEVSATHPALALVYDYSAPEEAKEGNRITGRYLSKKHIDALVAVGPRITPNMRREMQIARKRGIPIKVWPRPGSSPIKGKFRRKEAGGT